jgi:hypothetical protein
MRVLLGWLVEAEGYALHPGCYGTYQPLLGVHSGAVPLWPV